MISNMLDKKGKWGLVLGALGVVFGDIGTSPLYALKAIFGNGVHHLEINQTTIYGVISLVIWSVIIIVSIKYVGFIMKADNKGEGGIIALVALVKSTTLGSKTRWFFIFLGLIGVALFYGDSAITPAISVMSAVEGLKVNFPSFSSYVVPATIAILTLLFGIQRYGTKLIGRMFGPVMLIWFLVIGLAGLAQIIKMPHILSAVSPHYAVEFFINHSALAFIAMGAVVLTVTGAEALYADMGHFGRQPISRAWFFVVFPALMLCYMGQATLLLSDPSHSSNPFILLFPSSLHIAVVVLATLATLIASQSVISGAFSLTRQAIQLNFLPKMMVKHTSDKETGQIYLPFVNLALFISVIFLVILFGSSEKLANAYGIAVSGTLAIDTILFIVVVRSLWQRSRVFILAMVVAFLSVDVLFVSANFSKIGHGGWFPIIIALMVFIVVTTWIKGQKLIGERRSKLEGNLQDYVNKIHNMKPPLTRVPGHAVYLTHHKDVAPLALRTTVEELHELHQKAVVLSVNITNSAYVLAEERADFDGLEYTDGISHLTLNYGFHDSSNIPKTLESIKNINPELDFDEQDVSYFVSTSKVVASDQPGMMRWRKNLYALMYKNALSQSDYYHLPVDRTVEMRSIIEL